MKKLLVVVDMQNDFIDGALGSEEAKAIVDKVVDKIRNWDGDITATLDTHDDDYLNTREGKYLPVKHCIVDTEGWLFNRKIAYAFAEANTTNTTHINVIRKCAFANLELAQLCSKYDYVELVGLCTDICVLSNALFIKNMNCELDIAVDASCCAGVTPESHKAALLVMKMCQIDILNND